MNFNILDYLNNLSDQLQENNHLEKIINEFATKYHLIPRIGVEIEFYLTPNINIDAFQEILNLKVKKERGINQFEIELAPETNLMSYINKINLVKSNISKFAEILMGKAFLSSKPFIDDYGNSIHYHIDFIDIKTNTSSFNLLLAANSLCQFMLETFLIFMPYNDDYNRINKNFMAPTHVSHGLNNRTLAIRRPESMPLRLEHRLASVQSDAYLCIVVILRSILLGYKTPTNIINLPIIYGNAYDMQYDLIPFPRNIKEALKHFNYNFFSNY